MRTVNKLSALFLLIFALSGCDKNELRLTEFDLPQDKAFIRFGLFSPGTPATMIKVNDVKINGANTSGNGGFFPSVSTSPDYAAITPNGSFRISLPNTGTGNDSVLLFSGTLAVEAQKYYSVNLVDTGRDRTLFAIQDIFGNQPDSGFVNIRLLNAMGKGEALNLIRVDSTSASDVIRDTIIKNVLLRSASAYLTTAISPSLRPAPATGNYSFLRFRVITATSGVTIGTATLPISPSPNFRHMTLYAYGFFPGTGIYAPAISPFIFNK